MEKESVRVNLKPSKELKAGPHSGFFTLQSESLPPA